MPLKLIPAWRVLANFSGQSFSFLAQAAPPQAAPPHLPATAVPGDAGSTTCPGRVQRSHWH